MPITGVLAVVLVLGLQPSRLPRQPAESVPAQWRGVWFPSEPPTFGLELSRDRRRASPRCLAQ